MRVLPAAGVASMLLHSFASADACTHPLFAELKLVTGPFPHDIAIGDLDGVNGDDLVVSGGIYGGPFLVVMLNQGDGTFAPAVPYNDGYLLVSVAIGDLDGMNGPDLAAVNLSSGDVLVLLNEGDGTLAPAVPYDTGGLDPQSVAIGDLDGINGLDLAVANRGSDDVSLLFSLCASCQGDANGDGQVDVMDLVGVIVDWGQAGGAADVNQDGFVDASDLNLVIASWGPCP